MKRLIYIVVLFLLSVMFFQLIFANIYAKKLEQNIQSEHSYMLKERRTQENALSMIKRMRDSGEQVDHHLYCRAFRLADDSRNKYEGHKKRLEDLKQEYSKALNDHWKGFWISIAGFPNISIDSYSSEEPLRIPNRIYEVVPTKVEYI